MTLNLGISDEVRDNNDGQEPLQFTQVMDTLCHHGHGSEEQGRSTL